MSRDKKPHEVEGWFEAYSDSIFKYICMMVRDYQQAEDLTQETFMRACLYQKNYNEDQSLAVKGFWTGLIENELFFFLKL